MPIDMILPVSMTFSIIAWTMIFIWYINPLLKSWPVVKAIEPLLFLHTFRYIGLMFLIPGVTSEILDKRFAQPAAYGDLTAAILALIAIAAIRLDIKGKIATIWIFNIAGFVDLLSAVTLGILFTPDGHLGATFWIPATIVPLLLVTHVYIFMLLIKGHDKNRLATV